MEDSATPSSYLSRFVLTLFTHSSSFVRIHLSSTASLEVSGSSILSIVRFIRTNLAAFHSLFAKLRAASIFSSEKRISFPGLFPVARANLRASAPYLSMISSGSMPLPRDFDIFLP